MGACRNEDPAVGSMELAIATGAQAPLGGHSPFADGRAPRPSGAGFLGLSRVNALGDPGHTDESYGHALCDDEEWRAFVALTGAALFVGDVGRTGLHGFEERQRIARDLHDGLHDVILPLGGGTIMPARAARSAFGESTAEDQHHRAPPMPPADGGPEPVWP